MPGYGEILLIVAVVLLLLGYKRLPDAARSIGRSMRVLKAETRGLREDDVRTRAEAQVIRTPRPKDADDASGDAGQTR